MVAVYEEVSEGEWRPVLPAHCPFGGDAQECRIGAHDRRERQHGPGFALIVAVCHAHGRCFTLYPPGWAPWGRVAVHPTPEEDAAGLEETLLVAALDAAAGRLWPVESVGARGCGRTQLRWLRRCGAWLGLVGPAREVERAASLLGLPLASHLAAHRLFVGARDRRTAGRVVAEVLSQRRWPATSLRPWLSVGARSGVCGRAWLTGPTGVIQPVFRA